MYLCVHDTIKYARQICTRWFTQIAALVICSLSLALPLPQKLNILSIFLLDISLKVSHLPNPFTFYSSFFSQIAWFPIKDPRKSITELKWTVAFACIQIRVITCYIHSLLYSDLTFPPLWTTCACLCSQPTKNTRIFFRTLQSKITILTAVVAFFLCKLEWIPCFSEQFCVSVWSIHLLAIKMTGVYIYVNSYLHNFTIVFQFNVLFFNRI